LQAGCGDFRKQMHSGVEKYATSQGIFPSIVSPQHLFKTGKAEPELETI